MGLTSTGSNPVFPSINSKSYLEFVTKYNICVKKKLYFFTFSNSKKNCQLALVFVRLGLLRFHNNPTTLQLRASPIYSKVLKSTRTTRAKLFSKKLKPVSLQALHIIQSYTPTTKIVILTQKGLLTAQEALALRTGGLLLLRLM